jgi:hypothetical protein
MGLPDMVVCNSYGGNCLYTYIALLSFLSYKLYNFAAMKRVKAFLIFLVAGLVVFGIEPVMAQCAMCTASVETNAKNGGMTANGLNHGIMYLLAAPYLAAAAIGYIWYKKYRRKNVDLHMRDEKLHLN